MRTLGYETLTISPDRYTLERVYRLIRHYRREQEKRKKEGYIHATTLAYGCLKDSYRRLKERSKVDQEAAVYFVLGEAVHEVLKTLLPEGESEKEFITPYGLVCHVDHFTKRPVEIKTSHALTYRIKHYWIDQLTTYMVASNSRVGTLIVLWLHPGLKKNGVKVGAHIDALTIRISKREFEQKERWLKEAVEKMKLALEAKDESILQHICRCPSCSPSKEYLTIKKKEAKTYYCPVCGYMLKSVAQPYCLGFKSPKTPEHKLTKMQKVKGR